MSKKKKQTSPCDQVRGFLTGIVDSDKCFYSVLALFFLLTVVVSWHWIFGFALLALLCCKSCKTKTGLAPIWGCSDQRALQSKKDEMIDKAWKRLVSIVDHIKEKETFGKDHIILERFLKDGKGMNLSIVKLSANPSDGNVETNKEDPKVKAILDKVVDALDLGQPFVMEAKPWWEVKSGGKRLDRMVTGVEVKWRFKIREFEDSKGNVIAHVGAKTPRLGLSSDRSVKTSSSRRSSAS